MKPYQGILAFIGYLVLQSIVSARISMDYCEVISGIIALIAFGWLLHKKKMLPMSSRDLKGSRLLFCLGIGLGLALVSKTAIVLGVLSGAPIPERLLPDGFLWIPTDVVLIPIVEELLFRGILFGSFCRSFSYKAAIVLSTILFAMVHYMVSWPSVFVIGVLLAWLYWRTDNLAVAMVIHCTINLGTFLSMPLSCGRHGDSLHDQSWHLLVDAALRPVDHPPDHRGDGMPAGGIAGNLDHRFVYKKVPPKT